MKIQEAPCNKHNKCELHETGLVNPQKKLSILAITMVVLQTLWAVIIPIKNVVVIPYPVFKEDASQTLTAPYIGYNASNLSREITGVELRDLIRRILHLSLTRPEIRKKFEEVGDFAVDDLGIIASPADHNLFAKYYGVVFEQSEFLGGVFTAREETVYVVNATSGEKIELKLTCTKGKNILNGMKCTTPSGEPCDDNALQKPQTLKFEPVDFKQFSNLTSLENNFGLLSFVDFFHQIMRQVFTKKEWKNVLNAYVKPNFVYNAYGLHNYNFTGKYKLLTIPMDTFSGLNYEKYMKHGVNSFEACLPMEVSLGYIYIRSYVLKMVEDALIENKLYNAKQLAPFESHIKMQVENIFNYKFYTHSGAGVVDYENIKRTLNGKKMTQVAQSTSNFKRDRQMTGAMLVGSSLRHIWSMSRYPNNYYSFLSPVIGNTSIELEYKHLGGYHAGMNGMKFDFTKNVMAVLKISERTKLNGAKSVDIFDQEEKFAEWYKNHEHNNQQSLVLMTKKHFGTMLSAPTKEFFCYQGLLRKISQVAWLMALRLSPVATHVVYTAMNKGGNPGSWVKNQMLLTEVVGENPYGHRVHMQYVRNTVSTDTGNGWPIIPVLSGFLKVHGMNYVTQELLKEMNSTYTGLIELEGIYTQFKDIAFCPIGVDHFGVKAKDGKEKMYKKIFPGIKNVVKDIVSRIKNMHETMEQDVGNVQFRQEFVLHNRSHPIFLFEGAPVAYKQTALSIGLIRLMTKESPFNADLVPLKKSMICYNTLELRYLNITKRCWSEQKTITESRMTWDSEGLRVVLFSTWSMGVVLNIIGAIVAFRYLYRLWHSGKIAGWNNMTVKLAWGLGIQGISVLSLYECAIMAFSSIPLILSYHLPADPVFLPEQRQIGKFSSEFIIALSMTWFTRLGIEIGNYFIHLKHFNTWFHYSTTRLRNLFILLTIFIRLHITVNNGDYDHGLWKLIISCIITTIVGVIIVNTSVLFEPKGTSRSRISVAFYNANLPRNWYGTIGEKRNGWSYFGLIFEGWQILTCNGKCNLVKGNKIVSIRSDSTGHTITDFSTKRFSSIFVNTKDTCCGYNRS